MDNEYNDNVRQSKLRQKAKEDNEKQYKEDSKKRFLNIVSKKLKTSFIGAVSEVENKLGFLWGYGDGEYSAEEVEIKNALTKLGFDEEYWQGVWNSMRTNILNNGNNQIRALEQESNQYTMNWDRYTCKIPVLGNIGGNNDRK